MLTSLLDNHTKENQFFIIPLVFVSVCFEALKTDGNDPIASQTYKSM